MFSSSSQQLAMSSKAAFQFWENLELYDFFLTMFLALIFILPALGWYVRTAGKKRSKAGFQLALPPAPPGLPLVGNLPFIRPDLHRYFANLARTYGPIFSLRLGSKLYVIVSSASLAKEILKDQDAAFANHRPSPRGFAMRLGEPGLVWSPYNNQWRHLRKLAFGEMLSSGKLDAFSPDLRRREVGRMVGHVYAQGGAPVAIGELMLEAMLNVITGMLWGGSVGTKEMGRVGKELREVMEDVRGVFGRFDVFEFFPALERFDIQGVVRQSKKVGRRLQEILDLVIDRRLEMNKLGEEGGGKDLLQLLTKTTNQKEEPLLSRAQIKAMFTDLIMAGVDTTTQTMEWAMAEMLNNPEVARKAQEELQQVVGLEQMVEETHLPKLPYLAAIIKEVLRLHPGLPLTFPRSSAHSCVVGGYSVPAGTQVLVNMWSIHRDPERWENPTAFRPERFLTGSGAGNFNGIDHCYIPFGSGRRICVGISLADRMLNYVLGTLLHCFEWRLPEGGVPEMTEKFGLTLRIAKPIAAIATPRLSIPELLSIV